MAQSFGSALSLRIAAERPKEVAGLVMVNPWVRKDGAGGWKRHLVHFQKFLRYVVKSIPGVASDIADPNGIELGYEQLPVVLTVDVARGLDQLKPLLNLVTAPIQLITSPVDHVMGPKHAELIRAEVRSSIEEIPLDRSYHVATLDYDADKIFAASVGFIEARV
jgi:carboxylesterase